MPTITTTPVQGYAHCRDSTCPGNEQEQVQALREQADLYYKEWDPDGVPGVMNSTFMIKFADPDDVACPHCDASREVTDQPRPVYPVMTSQLDGVKTTDQRFLLDLKKKGLILTPGEKVHGGDDSAELAEMRRELAELRGFVNGQKSAQDQNDAEDDQPPVKTRRRRGAGQTEEEPTA